MRIRSKPVRPKQYKMTKYDVYLFDGDSLQDILDKIDAKMGGDLAGIGFSDMIIETPYDDSPTLSWECPEPDRAFEGRLEAYKEAMADWNGWYSRNKEEVDAELGERKRVAVEKQEKEIAKLEAKLAKLKEGE